MRKSARVDDVRVATSRVEAEELSGVMVCCGGGGADAASSGPVDFIMSGGAGAGFGGTRSGWQGGRSGSRHS